MENIVEWLNQEPPSEEIATNNDGSQYIPIGIVESLLDELTGKSWEVTEFRLQFTPYKDFLLISASIELSVGFYVAPEGPNIDATYSSIFRKLSGAITFTEREYGDNIDFAGIALSECIKNAAKKLGPRFGRSLNGRVNATEKRANIKQKPRMDAVTAVKYRKAKMNGDMQTIVDIENYYDVTDR